MEIRKCLAKNKKGEPCQTRPLHNEDFCLFHSQSEAVKAIRKKAKNFSVQKRVLVQMIRDFEAVEEQRGLKKLEKIKLRLAIGNSITILLGRIGYKEKPKKEEKTEVTLEEIQRKYGD